MILKSVFFNCLKSSKTVLTSSNVYNNSLSKLKLNLNANKASTRFLLNLTKNYSTDLIKNEKKNDVAEEKPMDSVTKSLMEFFDTKLNWAESKVKHGRPWSLNDLRVKSNSDLHKLWYVLHKERNMLLTMEDYYMKNALSFPSPERIAKVDESMENILAVVEERNVAFNLLETGKTNVIIPYKRYNSFGFIQHYRPREYLVPWFLNKHWKLRYHYKKIPYWSKFYRTLYRVTLRKERSKIIRQVGYATRTIINKYSDSYSENDADFVKKHFEKMYGYKPATPYHELIRKPKADDLPKRIKERLENNDK